MSSTNVQVPISFSNNGVSIIFDKQNERTETRSLFLIALKRLIVFAGQCFVFDAFCKVGRFLVIMRIGSGLS